MKLTLFTILLLFFFSCEESEDATLNKDVEDYLNEVVDIMESNSINRGDIDWVDFREQVLKSAIGVQNVNGVTDALRKALQLLGDNHSFIFWQGGGIISESTLICQPNDLPDFTIPDNIGYVKIPFFTGTDNASTVDFAEDLQDQIRNRDSEDIEGWIVDLRGNTGGNMWPMLAGIGPLLGEGVVGHFIAPDGSESAWSYSNGASLIEQSIQVQVSNPYELINSNPKVSVLLDGAVVSSGEAIAIAFVGRPNTQSFGSSTCGLSTSNSVFPLSDGSTLILTTAFMADRDKNTFGVPLQPDVPSSQIVITDVAIDYLEN